MNTKAECLARWQELYELERDVLTILDSRRVRVKPIFTIVVLAASFFISMLVASLMPFAIVAGAVGGFYLYVYRVNRMVDDATKIALASIEESRDEVTELLEEIERQEGLKSS